jgi:hypothetical protein
MLIDKAEVPDWVSGDQKRKTGQNSIMRQLGRGYRVLRFSLGRKLEIGGNGGWGRSQNIGRLIIAVTAQNWAQSKSSLLGQANSQLVKFGKHPQDSLSEAYQDLPHRIIRKDRRRSGHTGLHLRHSAAAPRKTTRALSQQRVVNERPLGQAAFSFDWSSW